MDLLTFVSYAAKRQEKYEERARELVESFPTLEKLEEEMMQRSERLAYRLRNSKVTFSEFERAAAEDTIVSSLAALMLGSGVENLPSNAFTEITGQLRYLWNFTGDIKLSLESKRLKDTDDFEEEIDDVELYFPALWETTSDDVASATRSFQVDPTIDITQQIVVAERSVRRRPRPKGPATWKGLITRLQRFLVTPLYRWQTTGEFHTKQKSGFTQMRRITRGDERVCGDCRHFATFEWTPMGTLPMPGLQCRCYDRCRCVIEYR